MNGMVVRMSRQQHPRQKRVITTNVREAALHRVCVVCVQTGGIGEPPGEVECFALGQARIGGMSGTEWQVE